MVYAVLVTPIQSGSFPPYCECFESDALDASFNRRMIAMIRCLQEDVSFQIQCYKEDSSSTATIEFLSKFCDMRANLGRDAAILDGIVPLQDPLLFDREFNIVWRKIDEACYAFVCEVQENMITASNILTLLANLVEETRRYLMSTNKAHKFVHNGNGPMLVPSVLQVIIKNLIWRSEPHGKVDLIFQTRASSKNLVTKIIHEIGSV